MRDMNCRVCRNETNPFLTVSTDELDEPFLDDTLRKDLPELRMSRCSKCGCLWATDVRQREQVLMAAYERLSDLYFNSEAVTSRYGEFYKWLERALAKNDSGNTILDVGCGDGNFLSTLSDQWSKRGLEPS